MTPVDAILTGSVTPAAVTAWATSARAAATALAAITPGEDYVTPIIDAALNGRVLLAAGGHFKTGKSTLLNAALGRRLLPEDDLPETGALCVLSAGAADQAVVLDKAGRGRRIPCTTDAIRAEVGLIDPKGVRRTPDAAVDELQIELANVPIPVGAAWIDTPGINDTGVMDDRAWAGVAVADVLIWVVSSRQPLAESEVRFLARRVAAAGPDSVVFVVNAFLHDDTAKEWQAFLNGMWPRIQTKLTDAAGEMGLPKGKVPPVLPVAARAAAKAAAAGRPAEFGGGAVRLLLTRLSSPTTSRVLAGRLGRAAEQLEQMTTMLRPNAANLRREFNELVAMHQKHVAAIDRLRDDLSRAILRVASEAVDVAVNTAAKFTNQVVALIDPDNLNRDGHYEKVFADALSELADDLAGQLLNAVQEMCSGTSVQPPGRSVLSRLASTLTPPRPSIRVPQSASSNDQPVGGAIAGGVLGFMLGGPIGAAIGAGIGGAGGGAAAGAQARARDAASAQQTAQGAGAAVIQYLARQTPAIHKLLLSHCTLPTMPDAPDETAVHPIEGAVAALEAATRGARAAAGMP